MTNDFHRPYDGLSPADQARIDAVCDRFESAWRAGERPSILAYLSVPDGLRTALLYELILLDVSYRQRQGETITRQAYDVQFPGDAALLDHCFARWDRSAEETLLVDYTKPESDPLTPHGQAGGAELFLGRFELLECVGRGGFGTVYRAFDRFLHREVALKVPRRGLLQDDDKDRFLREARGAGKLRHPTIVPVFDAGSDGDTLFICSAFVRGHTLRQRLDEKRPCSPRDAANLIRTLAEALHYAHSEGVIHRDVKPENILLDHRGAPYILDFGLARVDDGSDLRTQEGTVMGTPAYMSPEQAEGRGNTADGRTDQWSLGVILFELLTGRRPFEGNHLDLLIAIRTTHPPAVKDVCPAAPPELNVICGKCLEKAPTARYASCGDLAEDLRRWLACEPILARPATPAERMVKWVRRNRFAAKMIAAVMLVLLLGIAVSTTFGIVASRTADRERKTAKQRDDALVSQRAATQREASAKEEAVARHYQLVLRSLETALEEKRYGDAKALLGSAPASPARWELDRLRLECDLVPFVTRRFADHDLGLLALAISPNGQTLASSADDGQLLLWDLSSGRLKKQLARGPQAAPRQANADRFAALCWVPGTQTLAAASLASQGALFREDGGLEIVLEAKAPVGAVAASTELLLFGDGSGKIHLIGHGDDAPKWQVLRASSLSTSEITELAWLKTLKCWLVGCADGTLSILDERTLEPKCPAERVPGAIWSAAVKEDAEQLLIAIGSESPLVSLFSCPKTSPRLKNAAPLRLAHGRRLPHAIHAVRFLGPGNLLAAVDDRGAVDVVDVAGQSLQWMLDAVKLSGDQARLQKLRDAGQPVPLPLLRTACLATPSDGQLLVGCADSVIRQWHLIAPSGTIDFTVGPSPRIAFDARRPKLLWSAGEDGVLRLTSGTDGRLVAQCSAHPKGIMCLATLGDSGGVATAGSDGQIRLWSLDGATIRTRHDAPPAIAHACGIRGIAACAASKSIAALDERGQLAVWNYTTGDRVFEANLGDGSKEKILTGRLAFNADGARLCTFGPGQTCEVFATSPFQRLPQRPLVAGSGGTAILWPRTDPNVLLVADDARRFPEPPFGSGDFPLLKDRFTRGRWIKDVCVGIADDAASDRWFFLWRDGRLSVVDPRRMGEVLVRDTGARQACDLAINARPSLLAVAQTTGAVRVYLSKPDGFPDPEPPLPSDDRQDGWQRTTLATLPAGRWDANADGTCVQVDADGRVSLVYREFDTEPRDQGRLYYVAERADGVRSERVDAAGAVSPIGFCLAFGDSAEPVAVYREYRGHKQGAVWLARRTANGWDRDLVLDAGNEGFWPVCWADRRAGSEQLFHFNYGGLAWRHAFRNGQRWQCDNIGRLGDGMSMLAQQDRSKGRVHFLFGLGAGRGDCPIYWAEWSGTALSPREVVDPRSERCCSVSVAEDGQPVVVYVRRDDSGAPEEVIARRRNGAWAYAPLQLAGEPSTAILGCGGGAEYVVKPSGDRRRLGLWRWTGTACERLASYSYEEGESLAWHTLLVTPQGQPVVVHCRERGETAILEALRWQE